jgi:hypothetical protein
MYDCNSLFGEQRGEGDRRADDAVDDHQQTPGGHWPRNRLGVSSPSAESDLYRRVTNWIE